MISLAYVINYFYRCKDNANERNESLLSNCRVQLIFCKDTHFFLFYGFFTCFFALFKKKSKNLEGFMS